PVGSQVVPSRARPGANLTGLAIMAPEIVGKQLQLLREVVPTISRVAVLSNPANPGSAAQLREAEAAGQALNMQLQALKARVPQGIDSAFAALRRERVAAAL